MTYNGADNLEVMRLATNYNAFLAEEIVQYCRAEDRVLDFGAGLGTFADLLRQTGRSVECLEEDPTLYEHLQEDGFTVHRQVTELGAESIDFIFALNVLEHISDDEYVLKQLLERLQHGGRVLVFVPAFQLLYSSMDRKVGHVRRYSRSVLATRLTQAGFYVESIRYVDCLGFCVSLLYKLFGNSRGDLDERALILYDQVVFPVSRLADRVFGRLVGKNLLAVATRR